MNVRIHIERMVLEGSAMTKSDAQRLQASVESELVRLVKNGTLSREMLTGGAFQRISVPAVPEHAAHAPSGLGRQIARAVFRGIGNEGRESRKRASSGPSRRTDASAAATTTALSN